MKRSWAINYNASKYVSYQFLAPISRWPNAILPLELDFVIFVTCSKLASIFTNIYWNPGRSFLGVPYVI